MSSRLLRSGPPAGYEELECFFPTLAERAAALRVSRRLLRAWEAGKETRQSACPQRRIRRLVEACRVLELRLGGAQDAGRWLLSEDPATGRLRVCLLHRHGKLPPRAGLESQAGEGHDGGRR